MMLDKKLTGLNVLDGGADVNLFFGVLLHVAGWYESVIKEWRLEVYIKLINEGEYEMVLLYVNFE